MIRRIIVNLLAVLCSIILAMVLINSFDETLNPEIAKFLEWDSRLIENNGFTFLVGLTAPKDQDPISEGKRRLELITTKNNFEYESALQVRDDQKLLAKLKDVSCFESFTCLTSEVDRAEVNQLIADNRLLIARYRQLIGYTQYKNSLPPHLISSSMNLLDVSRLFLLDTVLSGEGGNALLGKNIRFWRMVLGDKSISLLEKMIAGTILIDSYHLLDYILKKQPGMKQDFQKELLPLNDTQKSIAYCLDRETVTVIYYFRRIDDGDGFSSVFSAFAVPFNSLMVSRWLDPVVNYFLLKNSTVNLIYSEHLRMRAAVIQGAEEARQLDAIRDEEILDMPTWNTIYNPVGKYLVAGATPMFSRYQEKLETLDGLVSEIRDGK